MVDIPILSDIYDAVKGIAEDVAHLPSSIWDAFKSGIEAIWDALTSLLSAFIHWVKELANALLGLGQKIENAIKTALNYIKEALEWVWDKIVGAFDWLKDKLLGIAHWFWDKVSSAVHHFVDWITNLLTGFAHRVGGMFATMVNRGLDAIPDMITADLSIIGIWKGVEQVKEAKEWRDVRNGLLKMVGMPIVGWIAGELIRGLRGAWIGNRVLTGDALLGGLMPLDTFQSAWDSFYSYTYGAGNSIKPTTVHISCGLSVYADSNVHPIWKSPARINLSITSYSYVEALMSQSTKEAVFKPVISIETTTYAQVGGSAKIKAEITIGTSVGASVGGQVSINTMIESKATTTAVIGGQIQIKAESGVDTGVLASISGGVSKISATIGSETQSTANLSTSYNNVQLNASVSADTGVSASLTVSSGGGY
jgi:hypothetical protein